jgi:hypothetical protein
VYFSTCFWPGAVWQWLSGGFWRDARAWVLILAFGCVIAHFVLKRRKAYPTLPKLAVWALYALSIFMVIALWARYGSDIYEKVMVSVVISFLVPLILFYWAIDPESRRLDAMPYQKRQETARLSRIRLTRDEALWAEHQQAFARGAAVALAIFAALTVLAPQMGRLVLQVILGYPVLIYQANYHANWHLAGPEDRV